MRLHILPARAVVIMTLITLAVMTLAIAFLPAHLRDHELSHSRLEDVRRPAR